LSSSANNNEKSNLSVDHSIYIIVIINNKAKQLQQGNNIFPHDNNPEVSLVQINLLRFYCFMYYFEKMEGYWPSAFYILYIPTP